jgi:hypothetical protein
MKARLVIGTSAGLLIVLASAVVATFILFLGWRIDARDACGPSCSPTDVERIKRFFGKDRFILVQYWDYLKGVGRCRTLKPPGSGRADPPRRVDECSMTSPIPPLKHRPAKVLGWTAGVDAALLAGIVAFVIAGRRGTAGA